MNDKAPFVNSEVPRLSYQRRPAIVKRDSDVPAPYMVDMGGPEYSYSPSANKKPYGKG